MFLTAFPTDLTAAERHAEDMRNEFDTIDEDYGGPSDVLGGVLDGTARAEISHAGEGAPHAEVLEEEDLLDELRDLHE